ncbi:MAG: hypothetical protein P4L90_03725 [Rhodopila sp.]|nr:hypothetical protein [Rhodopila sp.]
MTELSQHQHFAPFVGKPFAFEGQRVVLRLAAVDVKQPHAGARTPFTLIFHGPADDLLPEGLYRARGEGGALGDLYVMPIHTVERDRQTYQAVFN